MFIKADESIQQFIEDLDYKLQENDKANGLSKEQKDWLAFCIMGIITTKKFCWRTFERSSLGQKTVASLSRMFRKSPIKWGNIFESSINLLLKIFDIHDGILILDDTDKNRSKSTSKIFGTSKCFDKKTGGYFNGQQIMFLVLVSSKVTIPVGFSFYIPDPEMLDWIKKDKKARKNKVPKKNRPEKPAKNNKYPSKSEIALDLINKFVGNHSSIKIKCTLADAAFGTEEFLETASSYTGSPTISQLKSNQLIQYKGHQVSIADFFSEDQGKNLCVELRGKEQFITYSSRVVKVLSHGNKKRKLVALKYDGETEYRYIVSNELNWTGQSIVRTYALRWLIEVFFEDWKANGGWDRMTKHQGVIGAYQGVTLSLLVTHCLLVHPEQVNRFKKTNSLYTEGSIASKVQASAFVDFVQIVASSQEKEQLINKLTASILQWIPYENISAKHMAGKKLGVPRRHSLGQR